MEKKEAVRTAKMAKEMRGHLESVLVPFWKRLKDEEYGGYYGYMGYDLHVNKNAVKGVILNSRILWFFSNASTTLDSPDLLDYASWAYKFLKDFCLDSDHGGVYWSLEYDGKPADSTKHTYSQAFAIYALAAYYRASGIEEALKLAYGLFRIVEERCRVESGYGEAYDRYFNLSTNDKLSENGVVASKTMNTLLHVFEAYSELYQADRNPAVGEKMQQILELFAERIYNPEKKRQEVFFDHDWKSLIDLHSYGHDIEASWLIDRGCQILGNHIFQQKMEPITRSLGEKIYERAYVKHSLLSECENGADSRDRIWWVQAEAVVGFMNAWQKEPQKEKFLEAAEDIWNYIQEKFVDHRPGAEWFWKLDEKGFPVKGEPVVEPWKCPYHNGRMCIEIINRLM